MNRYFFIFLLILSVFVSPSIALFGGIVFALIWHNPYQTAAKVASKYLLQVAVVGLGFGMNVHKALETGREGVAFTIASVCGVMVIGYLLGKWFKIPTKLSYLISAGTAICGGSAIAAVAPVVKANNNETSISLAVVFTLNAIALFLFPPIGHYLGLSEQQFGLWAAIAIHDTSSVVGAGASYGDEALIVATTVKLTRALWIIPLSLVSLFFFRGGGQKVTIPWFILFFVLAMVVNTYIDLPDLFKLGVQAFSHKALSVTLFLIGSTLSIEAIRSVGLKTIQLGIALWIIISVMSLYVIM